MTADWVDVLEALGAHAADDAAWARRVIAAAEGIFRLPGFTGGVGFTVVGHDARCTTANIQVAIANDRWRRAVEVTNVSEVNGIGPDGVRALYYPDTIVGVQSELTAGLATPHREFLRRYQQSFGVADSIGIVTHPDPGVAVVLCAGYDRAPPLSRGHRRVLTQIGLHLEAAYRLRRRDDVVLAVIRPDGKVLHRERAAPRAEALTRRARHIERARTRGLRREPRSLELWEAMVDGRASIVERLDGGQRLYLVVENRRERQPFQALTSDEADTVAQASRGLPSKLIAYGLGVSEPAVSSRLASAAAKIGLCSRTELIRLAALLTRDPRAPFDDAALTGAERDVLELLGRGLTNSEIAALRQRSVRTIANQVARLLQKTGAPHRRALAALV